MMEAETTEETLHIAGEIRQMLDEIFRKEFLILFEEVSPIDTVDEIFILSQLGPARILDLLLVFSFVNQLDPQNL